MTADKFPHIITVNVWSLTSEAHNRLVRHWFVELDKSLRPPFASMGLYESVKPHIASKPEVKKHCRGRKYVMTMHWYVGDQKTYDMVNDLYRDGVIRPYYAGGSDISDFNMEPTYFGVTNIDQLRQRAEEHTGVDFGQTEVYALQNMDKSWFCLSCFVNIVLCGDERKATELYQLILLDMMPIDNHPFVKDAITNFTQEINLVKDEVRCAWCNCVLVEAYEPDPYEATNPLVREQLPYRED